MEDQFSTDIMKFECSHQILTFLHSHYEPIRQFTFLAAIRQEHLLHQADDTIDIFFDQLSIV
jgi:hypothetical protein